MATATKIAPVSADGNEPISAREPYTVELELEGTSAILFHRYSPEAVEAQGKAAKGSKAKKTDNTESFVYRNEKGEVCLPGEYVRMAIVGAGRYRQDPRSPRKSCIDMFKAGIISETELAPIIPGGADKPATDWEFLDQRRVLVQRNAVTRMRPAFLAGWRATVQLAILLPEYISEEFLHEAIVDAGRLVGTADFRPTYGRFRVLRFERL